MKIGFISSTLPFEADVLESGLVGGSENAFVNITRSWKKNNQDDEVIVYNNNSGKHSEYDGVIWKNIYDFYSEIRNFKLDCLISLREPAVFKRQYIDSKVNVLWSQDICNEPRLTEMQKNKYNVENIDIIFANSKFSYGNLKEGFPNSDIRILRNGYNEDFICDNVKKENIAIWNSTPFRGLRHLIELWPDIHSDCKKFNIDPKLEIYGGMDLYSQSNEYFKDLYDDLSKMPNTTVFGSIPQKELYKKMCKSKLLLYPNTWCETSCMALLEVIACGVWPISTNLGALNELIINGKSGYIINGNPEDREYSDKFKYYSVKSFVENLRPDKSHLKTWDTQAKRMRDIIMEKL